MKRIRLLPILLIVVTSLAPGQMPAAAPLAPEPWLSKIETGILQAGEEPVEFLVVLAEQADLSAAAFIGDKAAKGQYVYETLQAVAEASQEELRGELKRLGVEYRPFWIVNMIQVRGEASLAERLARRAEVGHIYANPQVQLQTPDDPGTQGMQALPATAPTALEWNIIQINANDVWNLGYNGQGVVVGGQDTGYQWDHPALRDQYRGWNGSSADHNYNWHDAIHVYDSTNRCGADSLVPCDDGTHGTHTMGTIVGEEYLGNIIGIAPGAKWIGCRNMEQGVGSPASYSECYQWFVAPTDLNNQNPRFDLAPDIINNSWTCTYNEGCTTPNILKQVVENVRAAGILTVHSAGNNSFSDTPACSSIVQPPSIYDASFTAGATNINGDITSYSLRGPISVDGSYRLKPDVSAPGGDNLGGIYSSIPPSTYGVSFGTSMAAPHVAGEAALILSARPDLRGRVGSLEALIGMSAVPKTTEDCGGSGGLVPNNVYGWGRIDALNAVRAVTDESKLDLTPGTARLENAGAGYPFQHTLTNTGAMTDTFKVQLFSDQGWSSLLSQAEVTLGPGESTQEQILTSPPYGTPSGLIETATIKVASVSTPAAYRIESNVLGIAWVAYLPLLPVAP